MMREENPGENRVKASKFANQNNIPKGNNHQTNAKSSNFSKMKSSLGSHLLVKGFSAATDKKPKTRVLHTSANNPNKLPLTSSNIANHKNDQQLLVASSRTKRSLISDLSCSVYSAQVHPHTKGLGSSEDLFHEIDQLRKLLQESKDRELKLQAELSVSIKNSRMVELERELELKKNEIDGLVKRVGLLEGEKENLFGRLAEVSKIEEHDKLNGVEMEVLELRRLNKELQLQKRNLACRVSSLESHLSTLADVDESDVEEIKAEASLLKLTNEDLCKQVEGLQISRMNEVEELVYLRWVNSCLRDELRKNSANPMSPISEKNRKSVNVSPFQTDEGDSNNSTSNRLYLIKKFKKWPITNDDLKQLIFTDTLMDCSWDDQQGLGRRHSISGSNICPEDVILNNKRRQSDGFICSKVMDKGMQVLVQENYDLEISKKDQVFTNGQEIGKMALSLDVEKRALRIPNPPPKPSNSGKLGKNDVVSVAQECQTLPPPPPPPPPPPKLKARNTTEKVQRAPQVVEFYHSLMKRDSRKDSLNSGATDAIEVANVRSNMIGEIENRSSHLLAIKADVETQGEFVNFLIQEVNNAEYRNIEDVVAFVKWLDDELCFLVDERAVLKHFDWPEKKADTLREAAFGYRDLKKLEQEVSNYRDDHRLPSDIALKKMATLSDRMERTVYNILRTRDSLMKHFKEYQIPTDWMLDMGILSKIKFGSVKLAKMYMKRVAMELQCKGTSDKDSSLDYMLLQGVRFAFRIHQFAGGFDAETMHAFEELRDLAVVLNKQ